ncbi:MAG: hypothetical protein HY650_00290 [Acidobacteria bacterium]|nr:hypothetical protein [Acidobacteriota bacterium]
MNCGSFEVRLPDFRLGRELKRGRVQSRVDDRFPPLRRRALRCLDRAKFGLKPPLARQEFEESRALPGRLYNA